MLTAIPLIRTDDDSNLTAIERTAIGCEQMITALMLYATIVAPAVTPQEVEAFTAMSVATHIPAEA